MDAVVEHRCRYLRLVEKFPTVRAIEPPDDNRRQKLGREVSQVYTMANARLGFNGFPMRRYSTRLATKITKSAITPHVTLGIAWVTFNTHAAEFVVCPDAASAMAQRTITTRRCFRCRRQRKAHGTAMAGAIQWRILLIGHGSPR